MDEDRPGPSTASRRRNALHASARRRRQQEEPQWAPQPPSSPSPQQEESSSTDWDEDQSEAQVELYHQLQQQYQQQSSSQPQSTSQQPEQQALLTISAHVCSCILRNPAYSRVLKAWNHGNKITTRLRQYAQDPQHHLLFNFVRASKLSPLLSTGHTTVDHELLSAFVERWHPETSSFHLPFGEMTVTLDDVSCLLDLPIRGTLFRAPPLAVTADQSAHLAVELFGVSIQEARMGSGRICGPYYRYEWLEDLVARGTQPGGNIEAAVRAYLLLLLSYSIFTCKTGDRAEAKWMLLLHDLRQEVIGGFAWGAGALAFLYDALNFACVEVSAQIGGYASLLQAWILFYFPRLVERRPGLAATGGPLCARWRKKKSDGVKLLQYRKLIDELTSDDVCWRPFEGLRDDRPFDFFSLYRGFLTWGDITVPYMPERVFRQLGYVQQIPRGPLTGRPSYEQIIFDMENY